MRSETFEPPAAIGGKYGQATARDHGRDSRRDGTFLPFVVVAGATGAALGWWHGWNAIGAIAPMAGGIWFAGIVAIALGHGEIAERAVRAHSSRRP